MSAYSPPRSKLHAGDDAGALLRILRCPETHQSMRLVSNAEIAAAGGPVYSVRDSIARFLPAEAADDAPSSSIRRFYEADGWSRDEKGLFSDTKAFVDTRAASLEYTRKCISRLNKHFRRGGRYLLDAGSGAIPHDELLQYGDAFERRVCVDLSVPALYEAQTKLGDRGLYVQGDLTNLPIATGSMDAVTCNHVIYQIPAERQAAAFIELWRVLKPGGIAVVVYWWPYSPLAARLEKLTKLLGMHAATDPLANDHQRPSLYHHCHSYAWFRQQQWPFRYRIESFRLVDNPFMRRFVSEDWRGQVLLNALYAAQIMAPGFCGRYGAIPTIVIHKD